MLKLRSIGIDDYRVLDAGQRIGRIRLADERLPPRWLWNVTISRESSRQARSCWPRSPWLAQH